jgi:hypothetical protein
MRLLIFYIALTFFISCVSKENQIIELSSVHTIDNLREDVLRVIHTYIDSVNLERKNTDCYKLFRMVVTEDETKTKFKIYPEIYLSSLVTDHPYGYFLINNSIVIVNTGLERFTKNDSLTNQLLAKYNLELINDLNEDGSKSENFLYQTFNPITWEIIVDGDSLIIDKSPEMWIRGLFFLPPENE